ncbi:MAG: TIGR03915 family putative DNA repair protein [Elusimicrobiales bacterium]|nr:TIGR03915 family putative DNA repair protein [Elusimicrobiales bacterium]
MRTYLYDGSFLGFLTALSLALERPEECAIARAAGAEAGLFTEFVNAGADPERAAAARALFERRGSAESWHHARYAFLSEAPGAEDAVLAYARLIKEKGRAADDMLADDRVKKVHGLAASVGGEAHMFKGFVRFKELADKTLYAKIEPDHNILPLLTGHFRARLGELNWVLHDARRNTAALYFGGRLVYAPLADARLHEGAKEEEVRSLWRHFFKTAAIKERINPKLQRQNVPLKYRKNLTEFGE